MCLLHISLCVFISGLLIDATPNQNSHRGKRLIKKSLDIIETYKPLIELSQSMGDSFPAKEIGEKIHGLLNNFGESLYSDTSPYPLKISPVAAEWYDYIIVGGGTAGSILALRLSEDSTKSVLVLEAGSYEDGFGIVPLASLLLPKTKRDWQYKSEPEKYAAYGLTNRTIHVSQAKVAGGISSVDHMLYTRGNRLDFDRWSELGAKGWSFDDIFPYYIRSENDVTDSEGIDKKYHGQKGSIPVSQVEPEFENELYALKALEEIGKKIGDFNGKSQERFDYAQTMIYNGSRVSAGMAYLQKASFRPKVHVILGAVVEKIIFTNLREAHGVVWQKNGQIHRAYAKKEIILAAGPYNTPKLLLLSGIGPEKELQKLGISVVVDSPGVGQNLHDHPFLLMPFTTLKGTSLISYKTNKISDMFSEYETNRTGFLANPGISIDGFLRTSKATGLSPDIEIQVASSYPFFSLINGYLNNYDDRIITKHFLPNDLVDGLIFKIVLSKPKSRGYVSLRNSDPSEPPLIVFNLLEEEYDRKTLQKACHFILKLAKTKSMQINLGANLFQTTLPGCDRYRRNSLDYCSCSIRLLASVQNNACCTTKMGSHSDEMSVVNSELKVKGVKGLRVIDQSIIPEIVSGSLTATIMVIAEKGADIIKGKTLTNKPIPPIENLLPNPPIPVIQGNHEVAFWPQYQVGVK
ncbi:glucose dehydrogenase [FAD, quinone]-like [Brevipalpus obovatus]|uniref:glucose dehydrogenase [FAD, quinone]-like n=1 Tax=Brevipalpus obovatus TaxID=246614 RepID=UPI003D9E1051